MEFFNTPSDFASIGSYELNWDTQQYKCWISQYITFFLLLSLQLVNMFWFFLILRILWRMVASGFEEAKDDRSEDDEEEIAEQQQALEQMRAEQEQKSDPWGQETGADIRAAPSSGPKVLINGEPVEKENGHAK